MGRFRLTGDHLRLTLAGGEITFEGDARVALCPCPDPPVLFAASGGRLSPTGDLTLTFPRIELFHVPVFALPYLWLRAPDQSGLLPPFIALRGQDGLLVGAGVHLPWKSGDDVIRSLDLTAAGYLKGGVELGAKLSSPSATAEIAADWIDGARVAIEARGALSEASRGGASLAWEASAIRGERALRGTPDLSTAAEPFDRAIVETSIRPSGGPVTALFAGSLLARAERGQGAPVAGPGASLSLGGALASFGAWSVGAGGLVLGDAATGSAQAIARSELAASIDARPGPFSLHLGLFGHAFAAGAKEPRAPLPSPLDAALGARLKLELPLIRSFGGASGAAPLLHWVAPVIELGGSSAVQQGTLFQALFAPVAPATAVASGGVSTAIGRFAGSSLRLDLRAGALAGLGSAGEALALGRLAADASFARGALEIAATSGSPPLAGKAQRGEAGFALHAHARLGTARSPSLLVDLASSGGGDPRAAAAALFAPGLTPGADVRMFSDGGTTLGVESSVPFPAWLRTSVRVDLDLREGALLAVRGLTEYTHPCGCLALGLTGSRRVGRDGVDLGVSVELSPVIRPPLLR